MSKKKIDLQQYIWSLLYTYYRLASTSSELRSIKYVVEKDRAGDLVSFYNRVKKMIAMVQSMQANSLQLDKLFITTKELNQVLTAIFGKLMVKKTHLLTLIQSRTRDNRVVAADLCAILVVDFVKCRDKNDEMGADDPLGYKRSLSSRPGAKNKRVTDNEETSPSRTKKSTSPMRATIATRTTAGTLSAMRSAANRDTSASKRERAKTPGATMKSTIKFAEEVKQPNWSMKTQHADVERPDWVNNFGAKTLYEKKERPDLTRYSPGRLQARKAQPAAEILKHYMVPNKRSVFLEEQENTDPQELVPEEEVFYLHEPAEQSQTQQAARKRNNRKVDYLQAKKTLVDTRASMINEMGYILKEKELTEDRIINGMALLKSNVNNFNNMLDYSNYVKKQFFDLYFKIKGQMRDKVSIPVTNDELRHFRTIDNMEQKTLSTEVGQIGEQVLFTETLHKIKKSNKPPTSPKK